MKVRAPVGSPEMAAVTRTVNVTGFPATDGLAVDGDGELSGLNLDGDGHRYDARAGGENQAGEEQS